MGICSSCLYAFLLTRSNKRKEAWLEQQAALPAHERKVYTVEELQDMGDKSVSAVLHRCARSSADFDPI